jgi:hypothetical protein
VYDQSDRRRFFPNGAETVLPTYTPVGLSRCAKCGSRTVASVWKPADEHRFLGHPEHILRTCQVCHYRWVEAVLDEAAQHDVDLLMAHADTSDWEPCSGDWCPPIEIFKFTGLLTQHRQEP